MISLLYAESLVRSGHCRPASSVGYRHVVAKGRLDRVSSKVRSQRTKVIGSEENSLPRLNIVTRRFAFPGPVPDAERKEFREFLKEKEKLRNGVQN